MPQNQYSHPLKFEMPSKRNYPLRKPPTFSQSKVINEFIFLIFFQFFEKQLKFPVLLNSVVFSVILDSI